MENVKLSPAQKFWKTVKSNPIVVLLVVVGLIVGITKDNFFSWRNFGNLAMSALVLNLRKIQCALLHLLTYLLAI